MDEKEKQETEKNQHLIIEIKGLNERNKLLELENKQLQRSNVWLSIACIVWALLYLWSRLFG